MQVTLDFTEGDKPEVKPGTFDYFFVRSRSVYDGKVRMFGAYYLNEYPLTYEWGCPKGNDTCACEDGCPTTGWFEETCDSGDDAFYHRLNSPIESFCAQPAPSDN